MPKGDFNADQLHSVNEDPTFTLDGTTFHPIRRTNKVVRRIRQLSRQLTRLRDDAAKLAGLDAEGGEPVELDEATEAKVDELNDKATALSFQMIAENLVDGDGQHPKIEWLVENLDDRVGGQLIAWLLIEDDDSDDDDEAGQDPTPVSTATTSG